MEPVRRGRYLARIAETAGDVRAAQRLRGLCFIARNAAAGESPPLDCDAMDDRCAHLLVIDLTTGDLACCLRVLPLASGAEIATSYSAQFYDLSALGSFDAPMMEVGRFCVRPGPPDPDIIRIAWAALTRLVDSGGVRMLFGCSSFIGTDPALHAEAFAALRDGHLAPRRWWPRIKAPQVFRFARALLPAKPDPQRAMAAMPPLLRSYLAMGGWVSDHAVVDTGLRTMHVFTGVEIGAIPPGRRRLLHRLLP